MKPLIIKRYPAPELRNNSGKLIGIPTEHRLDAPDMSESGVRGR